VISSIKKNTAFKTRFYFQIDILQEGLRATNKRPEMRLFGLKRCGF